MNVPMLTFTNGWKKKKGGIEVAGISKLLRFTDFQKSTKTK